MSHDVFISYSTSEQALADSLCGALENAGCEVFIASRDLATVPAGTAWAEELVKALQGSRLILVIYSQRSANSQHVRNEINLATDNRKIMFPVKIDDHPLTNFFKYHLSNHQCFQLDRASPDSLQSMVSAVTRYLRANPQPDGEPQVVINSASAAPTKTRAKPVAAKHLKVVHHITNRAETCVSINLNLADRHEDRVRLLTTIGFGFEQAKTTLGRISFGLNGGVLTVDLGGAAMPVETIRFVETARVGGAAAAPEARATEGSGVNWQVRGGISPRRPSWTFASANPDQALSGVAVDLELGSILIGSSQLELSARFEVTSKNLVIDSDASSTFGGLTGNKGLLGKLLLWKFLSNRLDPFVVQIRLYYQ